jgi:hypothetical protein
MNTNLWARFFTCQPTNNTIFPIVTVDGGFYQGTSEQEARKEGVPVLSVFEDLHAYAHAQEIAQEFDNAPTVSREARVLAEIKAPGVTIRRRQ